MVDLQKFSHTVFAAAEELGLHLDSDKVEKLAEHFSLLCEQNRQFNLTRITDPVDAAVKLYADSLAPLAWARQANVTVRKCLDIGTGAGFPAVPLAVASPAWKVTAIDATGKKARFVQQCADTLSIDNLAARHLRAGGKNDLGRFDLVVFKAVGNLSRCLSFAERLVARDAHLLVFKGRNLTREELDEGQQTAERIGMQTWDTVDYELTCGDEILEPTLVVYRRMG